MRGEKEKPGDGDLENVRKKKKKRKKSKKNGRAKRVWRKRRPVTAHLLNEKKSRQRTGKSLEGSGRKRENYPP